MTDDKSAYPTPLHAFLARWRHGYYRLCLHRSHRLGLPCFRAFRWDGFCVKHVNKCEESCDG